MENSHIQWTDHTFNPWIGCRKVSPGCEHCYAEARDQRFAQGKHWGKGAPRQRTSAAYWKQPLKWNREVESQSCAKCGVFHPATAFTGECERHIMPRHRIFCASLADWLDEEVPIEWLADLLRLIHATPNLDWQLLTKRPQNWRDRIALAMMYLDKDVPRPTSDEEASIIAAVGNETIDKFKQRTAPFKRTDAGLWAGAWLGGKAPTNVWIGTTVEDQQRADERIPHLLSIPASIRFLSCEPLLGPLDLSEVEITGGKGEPLRYTSPLVTGAMHYGFVKGRIHWVICGGESGLNARPMHPDWARSLRDQCQAAGVPFFFKQWGEWKPYKAQAGGDLGGDMRKGRVIHLCANRENDGHFRKGDVHMAHVGKKAAGSLLDGRTWDEFPKTEVAA